MARLLIGTSGWVYPHWRGVFYPDDLRERDWFEYYSRFFKTVEINNSFYRLPSRQVFESWKKMAPPDFLFTVKANRFITHIKRLRDAADSVKKFYENLEGMKDKCAAVLFQLPPRWKLDLERLKNFLIDIPKSYRLVFEFRDETWLVEPVFEILREHRAALCFADRPFYPGPKDITSNFCFYRMHGGRGELAPGYTEKELRCLTEEIVSHLLEDRDVFAYFNNDYAGYAVENALALEKLIRKEVENARTSRRRGKKKNA